MKGVSVISARNGNYGRTKTTAQSDWRLTPCVLCKQGAWGEPPTHSLPCRRSRNATTGD